MKYTTNKGCLLAKRIVVMVAVSVFKDPMLPIIQREKHCESQDSRKTAVGAWEVTVSSCRLDSDSVNIWVDMLKLQMNTDAVWGCVPSSSSSCVAVDTWNKLGK